MPRPREPLVWGLFSSGGMLAALFLPAIFLAVFVVAPLGWSGPDGHAEWMRLFGSPLARMLLLILMVLGLYHAAHRLRHTLHDGLQLRHLDGLISLITYGVATMLGAAAAVVLWSLA